MNDHETFGKITAYREQRGLTVSQITLALSLERQLRDS